MKTLSEKLQKLLTELGWSVSDFAEALDVEVSEAEKLLHGETVGVHTARKFIHFLGAEIAEGYIDWKAIGKENPYGKNGQRRTYVNEATVVDYIKRKAKMTIQQK